MQHELGFLRRHAKIDLDLEWSNVSIQEISSYDNLVMITILV